MAELHPGLSASLAMLPTDRALTLLTRHSVREQAPNGIASYDLPLTEEGVRLAEEWGRQLPRELTSLHSSPVGRCVDTARALARGAGVSDMAVQHSPLLVEPGCFVQSVGRVGPLFLQLGPLAFANRHLKEPLEGLLSPADGTARLLQHLLASQGDVGSLTVHVTHDTILAAFIYHLLERAHLHEDDWPWMLEGAWLWFDGDETVNWIWRGQHGRRDIRHYDMNSGNKT